jgi:hypothetical protein
MLLQFLLLYCVHTLSTLPLLLVCNSLHVSEIDNIIYAIATWNGFAFQEKSSCEDILFQR